MNSAPDLNLIFAVAIAVIALGGFVWLFVARTRQAAVLMSESKVPRRWFLLGLAIALAIIYYTRR